jgi:hypothetical protein
MATTDFIITDVDAGRVLRVPDGFLTTLRMTTPPIHETPRWNEGEQKWVAGYFVLRGRHDYRDLICFEPASNGHAMTWWGADGSMVINGSIGYRGDLIVVAVPRGSQWSITLSDTPNVRAPRPIVHNFSGANYKPVNPPPSPKASSAERHGASTARKAKAILQAARTPAE